ncbi:FYVE-FINGER-CONTAINING RAB5 EFFECTOR PROTEIN RABENOSYN-5-RELATED [Plasmopara halstedii]|uniref:FYVE-FINGER-CONTAINING RAB5 EFFECTOR PROTEIN RABENOSYN-5-RELATED n=1 Tax=Plasmopara halstedii TaxID=4781 RepID=A0A0N7L4Y1_PLAHL|nr:FYVE-FINGER-CONTAINING RAB5 EFFECTOR PROTEIN RABENOSYN-5-RELATED [Plasmopara halstedii]CEG39939.1 FYVE-FINGER-CONTAINING RAB5 EFFECTOR PROTEIN RABENOSYN-5-RELATED [Plasmopara halstedii]|eukprot:XP_024576308.1 FYVE-FINGER-CONTAINING RAB5 EFFECTOR PROTEIN RABENOSYN-5-RELATED [Plasmopara halstedii]
MASNSRFTVNPFPDLVLTAKDQSHLIAIADKLVLAKLPEYQKHINNQKFVDPIRWKKLQGDGNTIMYIERKNASPEMKLPTMLMVGPLPGSLDENMFGLVSPTLESMRIKSSYLKDFNAAAVLATIVEPSVEEPFRSLVVKWIEIDVPGASIGFVHNRDYVYLESTGIMRLANGERVGYHLLHSVNFSQTYELPHRVRGNLSLCGLFYGKRPDQTDCYGTGIMDPRGELIPILGILGMVQAAMAGLKYSYCGQMKKLAWSLEQKQTETKEQAISMLQSECVTCQKNVKGYIFGKSHKTCKLCFGVLCASCKIPKKLSFITTDLKMVQRKVIFCTKCLIQATRMDSEEAARMQFVHRRQVRSSVYGTSDLSSVVSSRPNSLMSLHAQQAQFA